MRTPRCEQIIGDVAQCLHVTSRCVRRTFLCGEDDKSGINYEHRRDWIETRIFELASLFAIAIHAYAVMSNHFHLLLEIDPTAVAKWSDEEVARRWLMLTTVARLEEDAQAEWVEQVLRNPNRLLELRERLGSLSWFMRYLKEPIARRANKEDGCTGHFWEGRFDIKDSLDDEALLSQMIYIDLNPMRAGIETNPELGPNTSAANRASFCHPDLPLSPIAGSIRSTLLPISQGEYLDLLKWTAGALSCECEYVLERPPLSCVNLSEDAWLKQVAGTETEYRCAVGSAQSLTDHAKRLGRRWLVGIAFARALASGVP